MTLSLIEQLEHLSKRGLSDGEIAEIGKVLALRDLPSDERERKRVYPSVASKLRNINLCLSPTVADQFFAGTEAWMIRIEEVKDQLDGLDEEGPFYRTKFVRRSLSIDPDGRINWSGELHDVQPHEIAHLAYNPRLSDTPPWAR